VKGVFQELKPEKPLSFVAGDTFWYKWSDHFAAPLLRAGLWLTVVKASLIQFVIVNRTPPALHVGVVPIKKHVFQEHTTSDCFGRHHRPRNDIKRK
jgi:hypothetical protein